MIEKIKLTELPKENILSFGEIFQNKIHPSSLEILTPLKKITETLNKRLILVCLTDNLEKIIDSEFLKKALADEIWCVSHPNLRDFRDDLYARVLIEIIKFSQPYGFFFPATFAGISIAPRIAGALRLGLCAHVNALEVKDNQIIMLRPTYGENIIAKLTSKTIPVMATISIGAFSLKFSEKTPDLKQIIFPESFSWESALEIKNFKPFKKEPNHLSTAKVVIAGGRGLKTKENFEKLFELAKILKAEVGATRPVCYEGWVEEKRMIGVSGIAVKPKVYIGFGISGALQHTAGMEKSEFIISINKDKEAPLVKMSNLAFITDAPKFLDLVINELKKTNQAQ